MTITGNHRPSFVTSVEESGIDRRLLLLTMNKKIADYMPDDEQFPAHVMESEGPAIMMWFMQGALEGWESLRDTGSFLGKTAEPFRDAAKAYRREANPFLQWISEEMAIVPRQAGKDIDAKDAFAAFKAYMLDQNPKFHMSKADFREGLKLATNGEVFFGRRTTPPNKGRSVFFNLTTREEGALVDVNGNVIAFPKQ